VVPGQEGATARIYGISVDHAVLDFGECPPTGFQSGRFVITNVSTQPVTIESIRTSCGCTTVDVSSALLAPGQAIRVPVHVDLSRISELAFERSVTVSLGTHSPAKAFALRVRGTIKASRFLVAIPGAVDFGKVIAGQEVHRRIHILGSANFVSLLPARFVVDGWGGHQLEISPPSVQAGSQNWVSIDLVFRYLGSSANAEGDEPAVYIRTKGGLVLCKIPYWFTAPTRADSS